MGNRLSKIYTRTGDDGSTGLGDGSRTSKDHGRVEAYGTVDELNCIVGMILACQTLPDELREPLVAIQHDLFDVGGELCVPGMTMVDAERVTRLENTLDALNENLPPLKEFILPGGGQAAATCHLARAVCRRAERRIITLAREETVGVSLVHYMNRLSDLLFVMARVMARSESGSEVMWRGGQR